MTEIVLAYPVEREGAEALSRIAVRRPRVRDIAAMESARERGEIASIVAGIASMNAIAVDVVEEIDAEDFARVTEALVPFLEAVGGSGGRSSPKSRTS